MTDTTIIDVDEAAFRATLTRLFGVRMKTDDELCRQIWSALANVTWYHPNSRDLVGYSFRGAGAMITSIRDSGHYMDWYCSGEYAMVSDEIRQSFRGEGWIADTCPKVN